ncbi:MAG: GFA family protein [Alphaproteobacteria bacterium]|nr:GFA family protein [Alphaproteobacteria bacterium]
MQASGHCQCGAVSFTVSEEPVRMAQCHCEDCRRTTGTGHNAQAFFNRSAVTISGETKSYQNFADSGSRRTRHFCPVCGSRLFSENAKAPDMLGISVGAFDTSDWFRPAMTVWFSKKPAWFPVDPSVPTKD